MLANKKCMLVYGIYDGEKDILNKLVEEKKLPEIKEITNLKAAMKIGDIIDGLDLPVAGKTLPEESVILFNNLSDKELDKVVATVRKSLTSMPILAVVTPTSIGWTFEYLLEHLMEEREMYKASKKRGS